MAIGNRRVNTAQASEFGGFDPLPKGEYAVLIPGHEIKMHPNGVETIEFKFFVAEGEFKGRQIFESVCIFDPAPDSKRVGFGMSILKAIGKIFYPNVDEWTDDMLRGLQSKRMILELDVEGERPNPKGGVFAARNRIRGYKAAGGNANAAPLQHAPAAAPQFTQPAMQPVQQQVMQPQPAPAAYPSNMQPAPQQYAQPPQQPNFPMPQQPQYAPPVGYTGAAPMPAAPQAATGPSWMTAAGPGA